MIGGRLRDRRRATLLQAAGFPVTDHIARVNNRPATVPAVHPFLYPSWQTPAVRSEWGRGGTSRPGTTTNAVGRDRTFYGSRGWGFESLRARISDQAGCPRGVPASVLLTAVGDSNVRPPRRRADGPAGQCFPLGVERDVPVNVHGHFYRGVPDDLHHDPRVHAERQKQADACVS